MSDAGGLVVALALTLLFFFSFKGIFDSFYGVHSRRDPAVEAIRFLPVKLTSCYLFTMVTVTVTVVVLLATLRPESVEGRVADAGSGVPGLDLVSPQPGLAVHVAVVTAFVLTVTARLAAMTSSSMWIEFLRVQSVLFFASTMSWLILRPGDQTRISDDVLKFLLSPTPTVIPLVLASFALLYFFEKFLEPAIRLVGGLPVPFQFSRETAEGGEIHEAAFGENALYAKVSEILATEIERRGLRSLRWFSNSLSGEVPAAIELGWRKRWASNAGVQLVAQLTSDQLAQCDREFRETTATRIHIIASEVGFASRGAELAGRLGAEIRVISETGNRRFLIVNDEVTILTWPVPHQSQDNAMRPNMGLVIRLPLRVHEHVVVFDSVWNWAGPALQPTPGSASDSSAWNRFNWTILASWLKEFPIIGRMFSSARA